MSVGGAASATSSLSLEHGSARSMEPHYNGCACAETSKQGECSCDGAEWGGGCVCGGVGLSSSPPSCHSVHEQPQLAECEVFLSRTRPANSTSWLAATLLSITNTGPIYPSCSPPDTTSPTPKSHCQPRSGEVGVRCHIMALEPLVLTSLCC